MTDSNPKREAAKAAIGEIQDGMRLGLGTGSTAWHFVDLLGDMVADGFSCLCVPTSERTAAQARERNIPLADLDTLESLDVTVDGADEIDGQMRLIKGGGGALLREKIVAAASARMIVIADHGKSVDMLGQFPLPVEVNRFGLGATRRAITRIMESVGVPPRLEQRVDAAGGAYVTDGGHFIVDAFFGRISHAEALSSALLEVPGVVQHGLFIGLCDTAFIAGPSGVVRMDKQSG